MADDEQGQSEEYFKDDPDGQDGEFAEYQEDPGSDEDLDKQTEEKLLQEEQSDSDDILKESGDFQKLVDFGIDESVAVELVRFFKKENIGYDDLDERARVAIKEFPPKDAKLMMKVVLKSDLEHVVNKSAYLCGQMKIFIRNKRSYIDQSGSSPGPDKEKLREILKETGYPLDITPGQRRYGGPPPGYEGGPPGNGHELVVGRIPRQWFEDKLIPLFQDFGKIYEIRLMIDSQTGYNRNFCFVSYCKKEDAEKACRLLNKYEVRPGKTLKANISTSKTRLYVGNIPKGKSGEELKEEFEKITPGIKDVIVYCTPEMQENNLKNKGYCFVEYEDHKQASTAKKKLESGRSSLCGYDIVVDWAEPQDEPDDEFMSKVKVVHVKNLSTNTTSEDLKKKFEGFGKIEKVQVVKDFGFVHFERREDALKAIEEMNGKTFGKYTIECGLSRSGASTGRRKERLNNFRDKPRMRGGRMNRFQGENRQRQGGYGDNRFGGSYRGFSGGGSSGFGGMVNRGGRMGGMGMGTGGMGFGMGGMGMMGNRNMGGKMSMPSTYRNFNMGGSFQGNRAMVGGMGQVGYEDYGFGGGMGGGVGGNRWMGMQGGGGGGYGGNRSPMKRKAGVMMMNQNKRRR
ncbi:hypothetical protein ACJMK2_024720 [Sinanodonta woodiana]|uniref:RRM domain-containing protein n=1 Tax=Sinanodonta woodiana TaxID=1069815 RepID=A0ABD3XHX9_SINWO